MPETSDADTKPESDKSGGAPAVELDAIGKSFGELEVLRSIAMSVAPREKVTLIGPSGSGKSTVLRLIMTLEQPTAGELRVFGEPLWPKDESGPLARPDRERQERLRRRIGMIFQHFNLFPHLSVRDNITLAPRKVLGLSRDEADARAIELLGMVGLDDKHEAFPGRLSGGQKQRVAIARALAMEPDIMLFDEVTSALDPELIGEVLGAIRELAKRSPMTMLFVTHQMAFAREISDRIVFMAGGHVVEEGPPAAVLDDPQEERTQAFLSALAEA